MPGTMVARPAFVVLAASSSVVYVTYRLLQWRARKRARGTVDRVRNLLPEGPLVSEINILVVLS
jgi:hypothetical protein